MITGAKEKMKIRDGMDDLLTSVDMDIPNWPLVRLAVVAIMGHRVVGVGCLVTGHGGTWVFRHDAVATEYRNQGIHTQLIARRMNYIISTGTKHAPVVLLRSPVSKRNYKALGWEFHGETMRGNVLFDKYRWKIGADTKKINLKENPV